MAYCHTCSDYLCEECLKDHKRVKALRDHKTVNITPGNALDIEPRSKKSYSCSIHPEKPLELYCKSCKSLACLLCFVGLHNGHDIGRMNGKARQEVEKTINNLVKETDSKLTEFKDNLKYVSALAKEKTEVSTPLKVEVDKKVDFLIQQLEARRKELHKEIDDACTEVLKELWAQKEYHETAITSMEGALSFARRALACKEDTELLALCAQITSRLKDLSQLKFDSRAIEKIEITTLEFKESNEQMPVFAQPLGKVSKMGRSPVGAKLVGKLRSTAATPTIQVTTDKQENRVLCPLDENACIQVTARVNMNGNNPALKNTKLTISVESNVGFGNTRRQPALLYGAEQLQIDTQENAQPNSWTVIVKPKSIGECRVIFRVRGKYGDTHLNGSAEHIVEAYNI